MVTLYGQLQLIILKHLLSNSPIFKFSISWRAKVNFTFLKNKPCIYIMIKYSKGTRQSYTYLKYCKPTAPCIKPKWNHRADRKSRRSETEHTQCRAMSLSQNSMYPILGRGGRPQTASIKVKLLLVLRLFLNPRWHTSLFFYESFITHLARFQLGHGIRSWLFLRLLLE